MASAKVPPKQTKTIQSVITEVISPKQTFQVVFPTSEFQSGSILLMKVPLDGFTSVVDDNYLLVAVDPLVATRILSLGLSSSADILSLHQFVDLIAETYSFAACSKIIIGYGCKNENLLTSATLKTIKASVLDDTAVVDFDLVRVQEVILNTISSLTVSNATQQLSVSSAVNQYIQSSNKDTTTALLLELGELYNSSPLNFGATIKNVPLDLLQCTYIFANNPSLSLAYNVHARNCSTVAARRTKVRQLPNTITLMAVEKLRQAGANFSTFKKIYNGFKENGWPEGGFQYSSESTLASAFRRYAKKSSAE